MPARSRPTARLLTPAGWLGVLAVAALAVAAIVWALSALPRV
ncbi:hypothetical protein [Caulobacter sp. FWC2]|nr:hypothetical protein [Caulobacter sp. FWC2]